MIGLVSCLLMKDVGYPHATYYECLLARGLTILDRGTAIPRVTALIKSGPVKDENHNETCTKSRLVTTVTLGLDGGSFELIEPWLQDGTLPNLKCVCDEGIVEDMQSCVPPVTCPNWLCYATGQNLGKIGVFWWEAIDRNRGEIRNRSSINNFDGQPFWRQLAGDAAIMNT